MRTAIPHGRELKHTSKTEVLSLYAAARENCAMS